jgi:hypothetical protein
VQKNESRKKNFFLQRVDVGHPAVTGGPWPSNRQIVSFFLLLFDFLKLFFGSLENGLGLLEEWVYNTPIFKSLPLHLEVLNLVFFMELGDFILFQFFC